MRKQLKHPNLIISQKSALSNEFVVKEKVQSSVMKKAEMAERSMYRRADTDYEVVYVLNC